MLSTALTISHDALSGAWPLADSGDQPIPPAPNDLSYLSMARRGQILAGEIVPRFRVTSPARGSATLWLDGAEICQITRPDDAFFSAQLDYVTAYAELRSDRIPEISVQTGDVMSFFGAMGQLNAARRGKTMELLSLVQSVAIQLEMQIKHHCWAPRPIDLSDRVQPIIQTPDHSAFPSGHATESFAIAATLHRLMSGQSAAQGVADWEAMVLPAAHRIAVNRTIAGVHYPVDSAAGAVLGLTIAEAVAALAGQGAAQSVRLDSDTNWFLDQSGARGDFAWSGGLERYAPSAGSTPDAASMWSDFWAGAQAEWPGSGVSDE